MAARPSPIALTDLHNDTQRGVAQSINAFLESGLRGDAVLDRLIEDIEPALMFHPALRPNGMLCRFIRDTLVASGVPVEKKNRRL
jgi:hypothetical protein